MGRVNEDKGGGVSKTAEWCEVDDYWPKERKGEVAELLDKVAPR